MSTFQAEAAEPHQSEKYSNTRDTARTVTVRPTDYTAARTATANSSMSSSVVSHEHIQRTSPVALSHS
jgi:hypothetical protein